MALAWGWVQLAVELEEFALLLHLLKGRLACQHRTDPLVMIHQTRRRLLQAPDLPEQIRNIKLLTDLLSRLINLPHLGPTFRGTPESVHPVVDGVTHVGDEPEVFLFYLTAGLVEGEGGF